MNTIETPDVRLWKASIKAQPKLTDDQKATIRLLRLERAEAQKLVLVARQFGNGTNILEAEAGYQRALQAEVRYCAKCSGVCVVP